MNWDPYRWGSWLFLWGTVAFGLDAGLAVAEEISLRSVLYLLGSLTFAAGCLCFVVDGRQRSR